MNNTWFQPSIRRAVSVDRSFISGTITDERTAPNQSDMGCSHRVYLDASNEALTPKRDYGATIDSVIEAYCGCDYAPDIYVRVSAFGFGNTYCDFWFGSATPFFSMVSQDGKSAVREALDAFGRQGVFGGRNRYYKGNYDIALCSCNSVADGHASVVVYADESYNIDAGLSMYRQTLALNTGTINVSRSVDSSLSVVTDTLLNQYAQNIQDANVASPAAIGKFAFSGYYNNKSLGVGAQRPSSTYGNAFYVYGYQYLDTSGTAAYADTRVSIFDDQYDTINAAMQGSIVMRTYDTVSIQSALENYSVYHYYA